MPSYHGRIVSPGGRKLEEGSLKFLTFSIEVPDEVGVKEKAMFVGHSMGGIAASERAATKGDRIKDSVILGPPLHSPSMKETYEGRVKAVEEGGSHFEEKRSWI